MRWTVMHPLVVATVALAVLPSCWSRRTKPELDESSVKADPSSEIEQSELRAVARNAERRCERSIPVYDGSIAVSSSDYMHSVERGDDFVDEAIGDLDKVVTTSTRVRFTLDYPFEKPFTGVVAGEITLRRTIDAIRAGFRTMYDGASVRDIPGIANKNVNGRYGHAFHAIGDLVIEQIDLCADDSFSISIGS